MERLFATIWVIIGFIITTQSIVGLLDAYITHKQSSIAQLRLMNSLMTEDDLLGKKKKKEKKKEKKSSPADGPNVFGILGISVGAFFYGFTQEITILSRDVSLSSHAQQIKSIHFYTC